MLPLNLSDTAATSQDGSALEFIAAIVGRQSYIQDASGRGLWQGSVMLSVQIFMIAILLLAIYGYFAQLTLFWAKIDALVTVHQRNI